MSVLDHISEVQRVTLNPGDIVMLKTRRPLTARETGEIKTRAEEIFKGHTCVVLSDDMDMRIVEHNDSPA